MADDAIRTCCMWWPDWPVVVARRVDAACRDRPVLVLEPPGSSRAGLVRSASDEARVAGVVPGLRRREAEARCPGVIVRDADVAAEARTFEVLARTMEELTPRVQLERPGLLSFPTRGPSRYFGGDEALVVQVRAATASAGLGEAPVRVGVADSRFAARLAARRDTVVPAGATAAFLASWPVRVIGDPDLAGLLVRLGLRTLDVFAALPPASVLARFGPSGARAHRLARGLDLHPPVLGPPPPELVETHEFDPPAERVDVATFVAKTMADHLLTALAAHGLACTQVLVEAETEHGEQISRCWRHDRALTPAALAERVRWQLEGWLAASEGSTVSTGSTSGDASRAARRHDPELLAADAVTGGLTRLRLVPEEVVPAVGRQLGFWGGDAAPADRAARVFARVQGLLGPDAVVSAVVQGGRTPAEQIRWVPWGEPREAMRPGTADCGALVARAGVSTDGGGAPRRPSGKVTELASWPGAVPPPAPARVLDPPVPAELLDRDGARLTVSGRGDASGVPGEVRSTVLPGGRGPVVAWAGPWLHDVRWWDPVEQRRHARWQLVVRAGGVDVACLLALERGSAFIEALYD